ncbi:MAG: hypothetical protein J7639_17075 [Paenibacillaceae bacterium]|uniref:hypothetical protein n=1 Tax=Paenibacillus cymbidii TaxID=1639034 RepID=UPI001080DE7F|nr:hypothetical protein [Paenibacillus cymbidii]MBO9607676.1 hypothetical protein [Paenibacillaceae bacterium]
MSVDQKKEMETLAKLLEENPKLMQAALSGMQESLGKELKASGLDHKVSPAALARIGQMNPVEGGNPVADDYVASAVSSVLHVVKVGVADLVNDLDRISTLNTKVTSQVSKLKLGNVINTRIHE